MARRLPILPISLSSNSDPESSGSPKLFITPDPLAHTTSFPDASLIAALPPVRHWRIIHCGHSRGTDLSKRVTKLVSDDEYRELQSYLISRPDAGALIPESRGLRKIRWSAGGKGKRSGARFIYYWVVRRNKILMLMVYAKNEQADLTPAQLKMLKKLILEEFK